MESFRPGRTRLFIVKKKEAKADFLFFFVAGEALLHIYRKTEFLVFTYTSYRGRLVWE